MALVAWYPLNGDTLDYSGNNNHATNYGAAIDDNGKIGKCYNTAKVGYINIAPNIMSGLRDVSISVWVNVTSWHTSYSTIFALNSSSASWADNLISLLRNSTSTRFVFAIGDDISASTTTSCSSANLNLNTWVHFTCVYKYGEYIKLYTDGTLTSTYNTNIKVPFENGMSFRIGKNSGSSYQSDMLVNDFRIYDHVLSDKEIKEISKAKILHYTFDDFQEPTENLMSYDISERCWNGGSGSICSLRTKTGPHSMIFKGQSSNSSSAGYAYVYPYYDVPNGNYTYSIKVRNNNNKESRVSLKLREGNNGDDLSPSVSTYLQPGETKVISTTTTTPVSTGRITTALSVYSDSTGYVDIEVTDSQLEKKDHATPFTPDIREGVVRDMSGYGNDAVLELSTTPQWVEDSKIGNGAYKFNGSQFIKPKSSIMDCLIYNDFTISLWLNIKDFTGEICDIFGGGSYGNSAGGVALSRYSTNAWYLDIYLESSGRRSIVLNSSSIIPNKWNLITVSRDRVSNSLGIYVNGSLISSRDIPNENILWNQSSFPLKFGKGHYSGTQGLIDDIRIYATALSDEDIKELYQTRMSVDNKGNIFVNQLELNPINGCPPFEYWTLSGGAYVENGELVLPNYGATAVSPFIYIGTNPKWYWSADYFSATPKPNSTTEGGYLQGSAYYDINHISTLNTGGYFSNGNAGSYPINKWTRKSWQYVGGNEVRYLRINISSNSTYSASNYRVRNPMVTVNGMTSEYMTYSSKEMVSSVPKFSLNERGILSCNEIYEVGMPIRYIRDTMNGSTSNTGNHWVEIQAIDKHDVNVALGKSATSPLLTDGSTATSPYYSAGSGSRSVEVDLGEVIIVSYLKIWHYYGDGRTYHETKTEVSADGVNWITVFDSNIEGEYKETSAGKTILLRPQSFSIGMSGKIFTNELKEV